MATQSATTMNAASTPRANPAPVACNLWLALVGEALAIGDTVPVGDDPVESVVDTTMEDGAVG